MTDPFILVAVFFIGVTFGGGVAAWIMTQDVNRFLREELAKDKAMAADDSRAVLDSFASRVETALDRLEGKGKTP